VNALDFGQFNPEIEPFPDYFFNKHCSLHRLRQPRKVSSWGPSSCSGRGLGTCGLRLAGNGGVGVPGLGANRDGVANGNFWGGFRSAGCRSMILT
jgi:hypothetical protein